MGAMTYALIEMMRHMVAAVAAGAVIGMERSFHGRAAGFRTHALVALASSLLVGVATSQATWFPVIGDAVRTDPTRMAQGIMTGIGFLGAGVIFKEGLTIRGLTTSASIWVTAAIGILVGIGFYTPALVGTVATILVLSAFRAIERKLPSEFYAQHTLKFARDAVMPEDDVRKLVGTYGFSI